MPASGDTANNNSGHNTFIAVDLETVGPMGQSAKTFFAGLSHRMTAAKRDPRDYDQLLSARLVHMVRRHVCNVNVVGSNRGDS